MGWKTAITTLRKEGSCLISYLGYAAFSAKNSFLPMLHFLEYIVGDLLTFLITTILLAVLGWIFLRLRFWDKTKRKQILDEEFDGSYIMAARILIWQAIAGIMALMMGSMVIIVIVKTTYDWIKSW